MTSGKVKVVTWKMLKAMLDKLEAEDTKVPTIKLPIFTGKKCPKMSIH